MASVAEKKDKGRGVQNTLSKLLNRPTSTDPVDIQPASGDTLPDLHEDLGEKRSADGMEKRLPHYASKEIDLSMCSNNIPGIVFKRVLLIRFKDIVDSHFRDYRT